VHAQHRRDVVLADVHREDAIQRLHGSSGFIAEQVLAGAAAL
jgi:hypothetical protein